MAVQGGAAQAQRVSAVIGATRPGALGSASPAGCSNVDRTLSSTVPRGLRRGVRKSIAFENFGVVWSAFPNKCGQWFKRDNLFDLSQETEKISDFLSHDWQTCRIYKYLSLCFLYNAVPASIAALGMCVLVTVLQNLGSDVIPLPINATVMLAGKTRPVKFGIGCTLLGPMAYVFVLLFWQHIRSMLRLPSTLVFIDRVCIDQGDADNKTQGILSLGGFVRMSDRLVILWSPRYFRRFWCVHEVASWILLGKEVKNIVLMPTPVPIVLFHLPFIVWFFLVLFELISIFNPAAARMTRVIFGFLSALVVAFASGVYLSMMQNLVKDLEEVGQQLSTFSVRDAECTCCAVQHIDSVTGDPIPCDRELLLQEIQDELRRMSGTDDDPIQIFDTCVQRVLGPILVNVVQRGKFKYMDIATTAVVPVGSYFLDKIAFIQQFSSEERLRLVGVIVVVIVFIVHIQMSMFCLAGSMCHKLSCWLNMKMNGLIHPRLQQTLDPLVRLWALSLYGAQQFIVSSALLWTSRQQDPVPQILYTLALFLVTAFLYMPPKEDLANKAVFGWRAGRLEVVERSQIEATERGAQTGSSQEDDGPEATVDGPVLGNPGTNFRLFVL